MNGHDVFWVGPGPRSIIQFVCIVWREHEGLATILKMAAKMLTKLHNMRYRQHTMKNVWYQNVKIRRSTRHRLQLHEILQRRYTGVPITWDTTVEIHRRTMHRLQLHEILQRRYTGVPATDNNNMRYHSGDTQEYQAPITITWDTTVKIHKSTRHRLQLHGIPQ